MALQVATSLLLAGSALASPMLLSRDDSQYLPVPDNNTDFDSICNHNNINDYDTAREVWDVTIAGDDLDAYIQYVQQGNADNWVNGMYQWIFDQDGGVSPMDDCDRVGSGCQQDLSCRDFFESKHRANYYWIMLAVKNMHNMYDWVHGKLQDAVIVDSLTIDEIADDFSEPPTSDATSGILSAAFTMGSGGVSTLSGINPVFGGSLSVLGGLFSGLSLAGGESDGNQVDATKLKGVLRDMFKSVNGKIDSTLSLATGHTKDADYDALPTYGVTDWKHPVANFFAHGKFLMTDSDSLEQSFNAGLNNFRLKLLDLALQQAGYYVVGATDKTDCTGSSDVFVEGIEGGMCMRLVRMGDSHLSSFPLGCPSGSTALVACDAENMKDDLAEKLKGYYGMDLHTYYQGSYDCLMAGEGEPTEAAGRSYVLSGGDTNFEDVPIDGRMPHCWFNPKMFKGEVTGHNIKGKNWKPFDIPALGEE